jgi:protease-4
MNNLFLQVFRNRMMIEPGIAEQVYLPYLISLLKKEKRDYTNLNELHEGVIRRKEYSIRLADREMFNAGADRVWSAMDNAPQGSIAVIPVIGEFLKYGTDCSYGANEISPAIIKAGATPNVSAVVLQMDSGGGAENAVPAFIEAIKFVQSKGKPVIAHGDVCASAAYYVASFCDMIIADNEISSAFGSIGAFISFADYKEQLKAAGVTITQYYATQSDLKNAEHRALTEDNNATPLIENLLVPCVDRFINTVKANRPGKIAEDSDVWRGKLIEGADIVTCGLADRFGSLTEAIQIANSLAAMRF